MTDLSESTIASAVRFLRDHMQPANDGRFIVLNPKRILHRNGFDDASIALLETTHVLVHLRGVQYYFDPTQSEDEPPAAIPITPPHDAPVHHSAEVIARPTVAKPRTRTDHASAPQRHIVLLLDAENIVKELVRSGAPFRAKDIRARVRERGVIAFAYAVGNRDAMEQTVLEDLAVNGFPFLHCTRIGSANGGKDTVDQQIVDLVHRHIAHSNIDEVVITSDDRDFASVITATLDRGIACAVLAAKWPSPLEGVCEAIPLRTSEYEPDVTPDQWRPEEVISALRKIGADADEYAVGAAIAHMDMQAPISYYIIASSIKRSWMSKPKKFAPRSFLGFVNILVENIPTRSKEYVTAELLSAFLSELVNRTNLIVRTLMQVNDAAGVTKERQRYVFNAEHPLCRELVPEIDESNGEILRVGAPPQQDEPPMVPRVVAPRPVSKVVRRRFIIESDFDNLIYTTTTVTEEEALQRIRTHILTPLTSLEQEFAKAMTLRTIQHAPQGVNPIPV
ncbi:MAG: NYN domain-containing protein [Candidatus Uhrbacteria bacterium]